MRRRVARGCGLGGRRGATRTRGSSVHERGAAPMWGGVAGVATIGCGGDEREESELEKREAQRTGIKGSALWILASAPVTSLNGSAPWILVLTHGPRQHARGEVWPCHQHLGANCIGADTCYVGANGNDAGQRVQFLKSNQKVHICEKN